MFEVMGSMDQIYTAGISPSVAREAVKRVKAETYISGSFQGREDTYWVLVNLVNTESGEVIWTNKVEGDLKSSGYLNLADSLCSEIKNYLEIEALKDIADYDFREVYPRSAEAYRYFIEGTNLILTQNWGSGIKSLKKALEIDSTFTFASFYIALTFNYNFQSWIEQEFWIKKAYTAKDRIRPEYQLWLELWYACLVSNNLQDIYHYCNLLEESGINSRLLWYDIGLTYINFYCDNSSKLDKAIKAFEKVMDISQEGGGYWKYELFYNNYGYTLHNTGKHEKEKEIYEIGQSVIPESGWILFYQAICALSTGDTSSANEYLTKLLTLMKEWGYTESEIENGLGRINKEAGILDQAEMHYRKAYKLEPQNISRINNLADLLLYYDINIDEGMALVQKGLDIQPDNSSILWCKGLGYYKLGRYEEAIQLLSIASQEIGYNSDLCKQIHEVEQVLANQNK